MGSKGKNKAGQQQSSTTTTGGGRKEKQTTSGSSNPKQQRNLGSSTHSHTSSGSSSNISFDNNTYTGKGKGSKQQQDSTNSNNNIEYLHSIREINGTVLTISYVEILCIVVGIIFVTATCVLVAITAEISIEIHYYDKLLILMSSGGGSGSTTSNNNIGGRIGSFFGFSSGGGANNNNNGGGGNNNGGINAATASSLLSPSLLSFSALDTRQRNLNLHHRVTIVEPEFADIVPPPSASTTASAKRVRLQRVVHVSETGHPQALLVVEEQDNIPQQGNNYNLTTSNGIILSRRRTIQPPEPTPAKVVPKLCKDGYTVGFDNWITLRDAIHEANRLSVDRFVRWSRFFAEADTSFTGTFDDESWYYEQDVVLNVCPNTVLRGRNGPTIYVNAPNILLSCPHKCSIEVTGGTHFSFGPHAKNVVVRGFTFKKALTSSLVFFQSGADVAFEDCSWSENTARSGKLGAVADINSTSAVSFYRCQIGNAQQSGSNKNEPPGTSSSLSVRT